MTDLLNCFIYTYNISKITILKSDLNALFNHQSADDKVLIYYILLQFSYTVSL